MKKKWFLLSLTVLMAGATACRTSRPTAADGADAVPLTGTCWKLTDLSGESVRMKSADAAPYLTLESGEHSVTGYGGCNRFRGAYELGGEQEIRFSRMVITRKMCLEAGDTE
ncbi:MAG: META domain-containing protein, partial [Tannerella sp.]|nr:META domain-containing protein [Tannerella sp.]